MKSLLLVSCMILSCSLSFAKPEKAAEKKAERIPASQEVVAIPCNSNTPTDVDYFISQKTYSNGNIRIFEMDTHGEPVCCSSHLLIYMSLKADGPGASKCFHIASDSSGRGFLSSNLSRAKATYDAKTGLNLKMGISFYDFEGDSNSIGKTFSILINQATQTVQVREAKK